MPLRNALRGPKDYIPNNFAIRQTNYFHLRLKLTSPLVYYLV